MNFYHHVCWIIRRVQFTSLCRRLSSFLRPLLVTSHLISVVHIHSYSHSDKCSLQLSSVFVAVRFLSVSWRRRRCRRCPAEGDRDPSTAPLLCVFRRCFGRCESFMSSCQTLWRIKKRSWKHSCSHFKPHVHTAAARDQLSLPPSAKESFSVTSNISRVN